MYMYSSIFISQQTHTLSPRHTLQEHERIVGELGRGVERLHQTALVVGDEASLHVRLLDGMDDDVERANASLLQETRHAEKVSSLHCCTCSES
jgi:hypothetical protein